MCTGVGAFFTSSKSKWSVLMNAERWWDKRLFDVSAPLLVWVHFFFQFLSRLLLLGRQLSSQFVYFFFLLLCEVWKMNASAWSYRILHWLSCYQFWFKCVYDSFTIHNFFRWQSAHTFFHFAIFGFHHFDLPVCKNRFVCCSKRVVCVCVCIMFFCCSSFEINCGIQWQIYRWRTFSLKWHHKWWFVWKPVDTLWTEFLAIFINFKLQLQSKFVCWSE